MECLSLIVSTRRSIFSDAERAKFVTWVLEATTEMIKTEHGLEDETIFHGKDN
jgi:hypothetical protein